MAVNLETNTAAPLRGLGRLGHMLAQLVFRTRSEMLVPRGYVQIPLSAGQSASLGTAMRSAGQTFPTGVRLIVVNVEAFPIRYCDADKAQPGYGELYAAGTTFSRSFRHWSSASFATDTTNGGTAVVNVSLYGEPNE